MTLKKSESPNQYWYDGTFFSEGTVVLPLQDPGWLYGATVFTTLRVYEGRLNHPWTAWAAHQERVTRSLQAFCWTSPDWEQIRPAADLLAQTYPVLRVTLFPDGRALIMGRSLPGNLTELQAVGAVTWVADAPEYRRVLPGHKTGNYLGNWLALQAAQRAGAQEAILIDSQSHWLETSTGNLWGWAKGTWWTPPLNAGLLPGVMRSRLVTGLRAQGQTVVTQPWTPFQVHHFECLAYTNSVLEVVPIRTVLQGTESVDYNPSYEKVRQLDTAWRSATVDS